MNFSAIDKYIPIEELIYIFFIPLNCLKVAFLMVTSVIIFSKRKLYNNIIYKYLIVNSIIQLAFILAIFLYLPQQCSTIFKWPKHYQQFAFFIRDYAVRFIMTVNLLINFSISYIRYTTVRQPELMKNKKFLILALAYIIILNIIFIFSNFLFTFESSIIKAFALILQTLAHIIPLLSIIVLNLMILKMTSENRKRSKIEWAKNYLASDFKRLQINLLQIELTKMIVYKSTIYLVMIFVTTFVVFFEAHLNQFESNEKKILAIIHTIFLICNYFYIYIFYKFNKFYAFYFKSILRITFIQPFDACNKKKSNIIRV
jgi:hypothetical protein